MGVPRTGRETEEWLWVLGVAVSVCGVLAGGASAVWSPWGLVVLQGFDLLLFGTVLAGVLLYVYVLHRTGM